MYNKEYTFNQFINEYKNDIGIILGIIIKKCKERNLTIFDRESLFKNLINLIYIKSDRLKLNINE
jgi:transcriptional antiterminator